MMYSQRVLVKLEDARLQEIYEKLYDQIYEDVPLHWLEAFESVIYEMANRGMRKLSE